MSIAATAVPIKQSLHQHDANHGLIMIEPFARIDQPHYA
jgi:hypothetical protein